MIDIDSLKALTEALENYDGSDEVVNDGLSLIDKLITHNELLDIMKKLIDENKGKISINTMRVVNLLSFEVVKLQSSFESMAENIDTILYKSLAIILIIKYDIERSNNG